MSASCSDCFRLSPFDLGDDPLCLPRPDGNLQRAGIPCLRFKQIPEGVKRRVPPVHSAAAVAAHPAPVRSKYWTSEDYAHGCKRVHERRTRFDELFGKGGRAGKSPDRKPPERKR